MIPRADILAMAQETIGKAPINEVIMDFDQLEVFANKCAAYDNAMLSALADKVVIANATGNEDIFLTAIKELVAGIRSRENAAPSDVQLRKETWQDICYAPKDGTRILICDMRGGMTTAVWLDAEHPDADEAGWYEVWNHGPVNPEYWMPLPPKPQVFKRNAP